MKGNLSWSIFWALVGVFVIVVSMIAIPRPLWPLDFPRAIFFSAIAVFVLLVAALIVVTMREKMEGII